MVAFIDDDGYYPAREPKGYGQELFNLLAFFKGAVAVETDDVKQELRSAFKKASDYLMAKRGGEHQDFGKAIKTLGEIADNQKSLRKDALETIGMLYNALPSTDASLDLDTLRAVQPSLKDADEQVRLAATGSFEKLGASMVMNRVFKGEFVKALSEAFAAEKDPATRRGIEKGMKSMAATELRLINEGIAVLPGIAR